MPSTPEMNARWYASTQGGPIDSVNIFDGSTKLAEHHFSQEAAAKLTGDASATAYLRQEFEWLYREKVRHLGDPPWIVRRREFTRANPGFN